MKLTTFLIKSYKLFISPFLGKNCKFYPSCSDYALLALEKYGTYRGILLTSKRVIRCNPFYKSDIYDPIK